MIKGAGNKVSLVETLTGHFTEQSKSSALDKERRKTARKSMWCCILVFAEKMTRTCVTLTTKKPSIQLIM